MTATTEIVCFLWTNILKSCSLPQQPTSIVSYNHLGNNDGKNLSAPQQFRSKEISKSNVVDDMVQSNPILYQPGEKPDHCVSDTERWWAPYRCFQKTKKTYKLSLCVTSQVVIKYVPYVGDSKRAMDEYTSEIMMGGTNTIALHNTCEVSVSIKHSTKKRNLASWSVVRVQTACR